VITVIDFLTLNIRHFTVWQEIPQPFDQHFNPFQYVMPLLAVDLQQSVAPLFTHG